MVVAMLVTICVGVVLAETPEGAVRGPRGKPVMLNGKIGFGEWSDGAEVKEPSSARL